MLIATHADEADCTRDGEGCLYHPGAARLLQDFQREFKYVNPSTHKYLVAAYLINTRLERTVAILAFYHRYKLSILPELHVLDAYSPNTIEMKLLKQHLLKLRDEVVVVR